MSSSPFNKRRQAKNNHLPVLSSKIVAAIDQGFDKLVKISQVAELLRLSEALLESLKEPYCVIEPKTKQRYFSPEQALSLNDVYHYRVPSELAGDLIDWAYLIDKTYGEELEQRLKPWLNRGLSSQNIRKP